VDTVSWVKGAHVFRFGGEFTRVSLDKNFPQVFNGELFFTNTPDGNTDFQNFLLARRNSALVAAACQIISTARTTMPFFVHTTGSSGRT